MPETNLKAKNASGMPEPNARDLPPLLKTHEEKKVIPLRANCNKKQPSVGIKKEA
jgi:hypothetical protein